MKKFSIFSLLILFLSSGCGTRFVYFQQKKESSNSYSKIEVTKPADVNTHIIQEGDVIEIMVQSADPNIVDLFSPKVDKETNEISGFQVKGNGQLFLPYVGSIYVKGKTINEARVVVSDSLRKYILDPIVSFNLIGFQIKVLGEVQKPGIIVVPFDRATILDGLALCGDLTQYGNPLKIKLIRTEDGVTTNHFIDLSDVDVFKNPHFQLRSNDIIYVETLKRRFARENVSYLSVFAALVNTIAVISLRGR